MKLYLLSFLAVLFATTIFSQEESDFKYWHQDSALTWNDFKGKQTNDKIHYASSNCNISYFFDIQNDTIFFEVKTYFDREKSWKKKHQNSNYLLGHEQGHFDIAELHARKLKQELLKFPIPERSITDTVKNIYKRNIVDYKNAQNNYDEITKSGSDMKAQSLYLELLHNKMQELKDYKKTKYIRSMN